jgi:complement component 1 Q subcomponent-binding protein
MADEEDMDNENSQKGSLAGEDGEEGEQDEQSFPARVNIVIEKAGKGALAVETVAQDGVIVIDNVYYYTDASYAHAKTAEKAHARQSMYVGPPFGNLDEDLQVLLERYLDERGINTALALFVPEYIDTKEQKEYLSWLSNVKTFIEA